MKFLENLDKSTVSMIFFLGLCAMFLILVIVTIATIAGGAKRRREEEAEDEPVEEYDGKPKRQKKERKPDREQAVEQTAQGDIFDEANEDYGDAADEYGDLSDSAFGDEYGDTSDSAFADSFDELPDSALSDEEDDLPDSAFADEYGDMSDSAFAEDDPDLVDEPTNEIDTEQVKDTARTKNVDEILNEDMAAVAQETSEEEIAENLEPITESGIDYEAIAASVREAEEIGVAIKDDMEGGQPTIGDMFGLSEEMAKYGPGRRKREQSAVSSDEEFYWFNRDDVESRPSHRKAELYYHYFNVPDDCIEDLLVEMYDCAVVRTEEIRYIAYGIEPQAYSMKQIMTGSFDANAGRKKNPTPQDLVKIYEKWCNYVERLLDKVEIHADEYTIQAIKDKLCQFGKSDVETLLEGK